QIDELERGGSLTLRGRNGKPVRVIHLALSHVEDLTSVPFHSFRERVSTIGTYFNISATEAFNLYQAAEMLVRERFEGELIELEIGIYRLKEFGFIHDVWVEEKYRNEGIARQMVTLAVERFREIGVNQVRLDAACANQPARNLFAACGFRPSIVEMLIELT